jgi:hypothetical protein
VSWQVEFTDEFECWWSRELSEGAQDEIAAVVGLLEAIGPHLPFPYSSGIARSKFAHMRELRIQHGGKPYRVFYAFDPRRVAILLIGGKKSGDDRWYERYVPVADRLYDEHLFELRLEELI